MSKPYPEIELVRLLLGVLLFFLPIASVCAEYNCADSIMESVFSYMEREQLSIGRFESDVYIRFQIQTRRRNIGSQFIPGTIRLEKGKNTYIGESSSKFNYSAPGIMDYKNIAFHCTHRRIKEIHHIILSNAFFFLYDPSLMKNKVLSPFHIRNKKYYKYQLDSTYIHENEAYHHILIKPRFHNTQLVTGAVTVRQNTGNIAYADLHMNYDMINIRIQANMGKSGVESLLPGTANIEANFSFLKNSISTKLNITYAYTKAELLSDSTHIPKKSDEGKRYDLTYLNQLKIDTNLTEYDRHYFDRTRPYPLTPTEDSLYRFSSVDTINRDKHMQNKFFQTETMEDLLLGSHSIKITPKGILRLPPLLTPSMFQWSKRNFSLQTRIGFKYESYRNRVLNATARLGYNFKEKQFYWKIPLSYIFAPSVLGQIDFEVGNGNRIYSSLQANDIRNAIKNHTDYDTLIHIFDNYNFNYYKDFHSKLNCSFEPLNGIVLTGGLTYHRRSLINWNTTAQESGFTRTYESFAPHLRVTWTPAYYYYLKGKRKVHLYSYWPTFSLDYERAVHWFGSNNEYEKWEFDVQYKHTSYTLQSLYLRFGFGFYTQQESMYFVDYNHFRYNSLPNGWDDEISGTFQLLDSRWYNESEYYVRLCMAYESPMLALSRIRHLSKYIQKERLYCNTLTVNALKPYMEFGYGISTHALDFALFCAVANGKSTSFGTKFIFKLFDNW